MGNTSILHDIAKKCPITIIYDVSSQRTTKRYVSSMISLAVDQLISDLVFSKGKCCGVA
jgi:hypothetical protein